MCLTKMGLGTTRC